MVYLQTNDVEVSRLSKNALSISPTTEGIQQCHSPLHSTYRHGSSHMHCCKRVLPYYTRSLVSLVRDEVAVKFYNELDNTLEPLILDDLQREAQEVLRRSVAQFMPLPIHRM
jgi:hypothetical protein